MAQATEKFAGFLNECDTQGADPFTRMKRFAHQRIDTFYDNLETKYHEGRAGKTWADLADEVYDDVKEGWDELSKEAADWYYEN